MPPLPHELLNVVPSQAPFLSPPPPLLPSLSFPPPLPISPFDPLSASFHPSVAVIIGVLTTMFSLTFLLLLYAKHCKRHGLGIYDHSDLSIANASPAAPPPPPLLRDRDSGVDRSIIDILPTFSFATLLGAKDGLECAVCLSCFDASDILRLLPKCKHAFHLECVDTWLSNHSTCPLCRNRVEAGDVVNIVEAGAKCSLEEQQQSEHSLVGHMSSGERTLNAEAASGIGRAFQLYVERESDSHGSPPILDAINRACNSSRRETICRSGSQKLKHEIEWLESDLGNRDFIKRFAHRIIISDALSQHRWSDFVPSDVLFLSSQIHSARVPDMDVISADNRSCGRVSMEASCKPSASTVATNASSRLERKSSSHRDVHGMHGSSIRIDVPSRQSGSKIQDFFLSRLMGSRNSSKGADLGLLNSGGEGDVEDAVNSSKQAREARGRVFERQGSFLKGAFVTGRAEPGSSSQMPLYQRSVSEGAGIRRYAESAKSLGNRAEESKQWLSIARTTLTWVMGGAKGRPFAG